MNHPYSRRQFWLSLACAVCWLICFVLGIADVVLFPDTQRPLDFCFLVIWAIAAGMNVRECVCLWKKEKEEDI